MIYNGILYSVADVHSTIDILVDSMNARATKSNNQHFSLSAIVAENVAAYISNLMYSTIDNECIKVSFNVVLLSQADSGCKTQGLCTLNNFSLTNHKIICTIEMSL